MAANITRLTKVIILSVLIVLISCQKEYTADDSGTDNSTELLNRKWIINPATNSTVESIEFLYGNTYLLRLSDASLKKGKYSMDGSGSRISLGGFGTMTIKELTDKSLSFDLAINGGSTLKALGSTPTSRISTNASSRKISNQPWILYEEYSVNGSSVDTIYYPQTYQYSQGTIYRDIIFSPNGTYVVSTIDQLVSGLDTTYLYRGWQWADSIQTKIKYFDIPASPDSGVVTITKLTEDSFNMQEPSGYFFLRK